MTLNTIWFLLIGVLYTGFFVLEGFDFGVGILLPFLSRDRDPAAVDRKRRVIINTIGPHWDGNEVWLLTAGGATFAAFPQWYATLFSGFYLPLFLLLLALIVRGVAFEFRSKDENPRWRSLWDWCIFTGSLAPALLLGVAFANLVRGVPIDAEMNYVGGFFNLLNPYALVAGIAAVLTFTLYGAVFLNLKTSGELMERSLAFARRLWPVVIVALLALFVGTYLETNFYEKFGLDPGIIPLAGVATALVSGWFIRRKQPGWAFILLLLTIVLTMVTLFMTLYPNLMVSSLDPALSLTIENAASSPYTLRVMTIVALAFVPVVVAYQVWSYWVFRKRLSTDSKLVY